MSPLLKMLSKFDGEMSPPFLCSSPTPAYLSLVFLAAKVRVFSQACQVVPVNGSPRK